MSPELKRGPFEAEEDRTIILAHAEFGNQWSRMAKLLPGRTDNAIKNRWHSALKRTVSEGLTAGAGGAGDLPPVREAQQQPSHLAAGYYGHAQRQASADSPAWRGHDAADPDRQVQHAATIACIVSSLSCGSQHSSIVVTCAAGGVRATSWLPGAARHAVEAWSRL